MKDLIQKALVHPAGKPLSWALYAVPLAGVVLAGVADRLGANPAEKLIHETGEWALRWLWLALAITPLREIFQMPQLLRYRRGLGVAAFVYALLHVVAYAWLDKGWVLDEIVNDIVKRNFILVGAVALLLMTPLALTSFNAAVRALGGARWRLLHKLAYAAAMAVLLHFLWKKSGKNDYAEVVVYALGLAALLGWRFGRFSSQVGR